jgi:threonine dehydrogenase-like Zn-dependent dehydrogenase
MFDNGAFAGQRFDPEMRLFVPDDAPPARPSLDSPRNMGTTGMGTVIEVGSEVTAWKPGDKVFGLMDIRETNVCQSQSIWSLGDLDPRIALCIEAAYVSFHCVRESQVRFGDKVAVVGLGALGLLAVRMAYESGAETVIAIDPLESRRQLALDLGADHVFDPMEVDAALETHLVTGNAGVDVAIELSGAYPALQTAIRCARVGGTVCSAGFYQGESKGLWLGREWHHNRLTMIVPHGCGWGHQPRDYPLWDGQRAYDSLAQLMQKGRVAVHGLINMILPFDEGTQVFDIIRDRPNDVIKFAIQF